MKNNKGSAALEAMLVVPLFLFAMMAFVYMGKVMAVKSVVYEASIETAEYMAEYAYLADEFSGSAAVGDYIVAHMKFEDYIDDTDLVDKFVENGSAGVSFFGSDFPDDDGYINLIIKYKVKINVPFICNFTKKCEEVIRQKAYLGFDNTEGNENGEGEDKYVYVTDNMEAYHSSRSCSYLNPQISILKIDNAKDEGYTTCEYCGNISSDVVYVTEDGGKYHSTSACSRLKRTVYRKKLSELGGISPCQRCN